MRLSSWRALLPLLCAGACTFPEYAFVPSGEANGGAAGGAGFVGLAGAAGNASNGACADGVKGANETGIDCGGECKPCQTTPVLPTCSDGVRGPSETGIDCGGPCPGCKSYEDCAAADDCESGHCELGVCQPPSCSDGQKNGAESDTDCGGRCPLCAPARSCNTEADCDSGVCTTAKCQKPSCSDRVPNGNETGVDCGGACPACSLGMPCSMASDCLSQSCDAARSLCVAELCQDMIKNGLETDKDCGGDACAPCVPGLACSKNSDCTSLVCNATSKRCDAPSCTDAVLNQDESDADCGGTKCPHCANALKCRDASDCSSGVCQAKLCVPAKATGMRLSQDGWVATASDTFYSSLPQYMLDGDPNNRWTSGKSQALGMFVTVDMRKPQIFFNINLDATGWPADAGRRYKVYTSNDANFSADYKEFSAGKASQDLTFETAVVARFVKIELTLPGTEWWSIGELTITQ